jgi:aminoglycoside phosphotransferase (APT) family kinase protein
MANTGLDEERVSAWLRGNVESLVGPFEFELLAGGRSNLTFRATDARGRQVVVRRPPLGSVLATAHDMVREHRLISAIGSTGTPVAKALGLCTDESVNGAPFYVMSLVGGAVLDTEDKAGLVDPVTRRVASDALVDVLVDLHAVDIDAVGLGDLARRDGYLERQLKRWSMQWASSKQREIPELEEVERRLRLHVPVQRGSVIAHGDYRFGNCLIDPMTGAVNAVLDWELCTLGDPLADVGYLLMHWSDEGEHRQHNDPTGAGGFATRRDMLERYADRSGRDLAGVSYYETFALWRLACIAEGVYARYRAGVMGASEDLTALADGPIRLATAALAADENGI